MFKIKGIFKTHKSTHTSVGAAFLIGSGLSAIILVFISFIAAIIANATSDPVGSLGVYTLVSLIVSAILSGAVTSRIGSNGGLKTAVLSALMITLIMMLIGVISNAGALPRDGIMNYLCYIATFIFSAYLLRHREGGKHRRHSRH